MMPPFFVKCSQCKQLYEGSNMLCPNCKCGRIIQRIFWTKADFAEEVRLRQEASHEH